MNQSIIAIVLSSGVVSALATAFFAYITTQRGDTLEYITKERQKWREELREIALELENSDISNYNIVLSKIKVRINAYGNTINSSYKDDKHIWNEMKLLSDAAKSNKLTEFNLHKETMLFYISMLLKYDWERSKREVSGRKDEKINLLCMLLGVLYCLYFNYNTGNTITYEGLPTLIIGVVLFPFIISILIKDVMKKWSNQHKLRYKVKYILFFIFLIMTLLSIFKEISLKYIIDEISYITAVMFISIFLVNLTNGIKFVTDNYAERYYDKIESFIKDNRFTCDNSVQNKEKNNEGTDNPR